MCSLFSKESFFAVSLSAVPREGKEGKETRSGCIGSAPKAAHKRERKKKKTSRQDGLPANDDCSLSPLASRSSSLSCFAPRVVCACLVRRGEGEGKAKEETKRTKQRRLRLPSPSSPTSNRYGTKSEGKRREATCAQRDPTLTRQEREREREGSPRNTSTHHHHPVNSTEVE